MKNCCLTMLKKAFLTLIFTAMVIIGYSQETPAFDKMNTSAGVVEMYFIGHGSLMFKLNGFVIYFLSLLHMSMEIILIQSLLKT